MPVYTYQPNVGPVEVDIEAPGPLAIAPPLEREPAPVEEVPDAESAPEEVPDETPPPASAPEPPPVEPEPSTPDEPRGEGGFQRRIKTLVSQRNELRQEALRLQAQVAALQRQQQQSPQPQPTVPTAPQPGSVSGPEKPRQESYATYEDWVEALTDWKTDTRIQQVIQEREAAQAQRQQQTVAQAVQQRFMEGQIKYDDFEDVTANPDSIVTHSLVPVVQHFVAQSAQGADILYYFGQHPEEVRELNDRTPQGAERWLAGLAQRLAQPAAAPPEPPAAPPPTPAPKSLPAKPAAPALAQSLPPPLQPVRGNGTTPIVQDAEAIADRGGSLLDYMRARGYRN